MSVSTGPDGASNELYLKYGDAPMRSSFDVRGVRPNSADQVAEINSTGPGRAYYVLVYAATFPRQKHFRSPLRLPTLRSMKSNRPAVAIPD